MFDISTLRLQSVCIAVVSSTCYLGLAEQGMQCWNDVVLTSDAEFVRLEAIPILYLITSNIDIFFSFLQVSY